MEEKESTASNFIWALAFVIIALILGGVAYFGIKQMNRTTRHEVDVNISVPNR